MGYDTVGISPLGGVVRNVGLVAGSYAIRTEATASGSPIRIETQILGLNLKFIPEPRATAVLASGLGLLGLLAERRRGIREARPTPDRCGASPEKRERPA
jgi:hypothetical protein